MMVSVIVCCYNSEQRIGPTLKHLQAQALKAVGWEVVLVDNNCSDATVDVAKDAWTRSDVALRFVEETIPGLSAARDCGVEESAGAYILFCDDDNWLDPDYLQRAVTFMEASPDYAAIGGWGDVVTDPDVKIPEWFGRFETKYACGKTNAEGDVDTLVGAGMFIRKEALLSLQRSGFRSLLSDRKGEALSSGGDLELCLALRHSGLKLYFSEELYFKHYMPEGRLTEDYLIRMCHGHALSRPVIGEYGRLLALQGVSGQLLRKTVPFWLLAIYRLVSGILGVIGQCGDDLPSKVQHAIESATNQQYRKLLLSGEVFGLRQKIKRNLSL
jgi:glycosyltransferase involved in cell wall biosynthesis